MHWTSLGAPMILSLFLWTCSWAPLTAEPATTTAASGFSEILQKEEPVRLDLVREERLQGEDRPTFVQEGEVAHQGIRVLYPFGPDAPLDLLRADGSSICVMRLDFSLHPPEGARDFLRLTVRIALADRQVEVLDVFPSSLLPSDEQPQTLAVTPGAQFLPLPSGTPRPGPFVVTGLRPISTGHREERANAIYWIFRPEQTHALPTGARSAFVLIRVPRGRTRLAGKVHYETEIGGYLASKLHFLGTAKAKAVPFTIDLGPLRAARQPARSGSRRP